MYCPYCSHTETKVLESRLQPGALRRRRSCLSCQNRFTTYETASFSLKVIKRDGREEEFSLSKITSGIERAFGKTDPETISLLGKKIHQRILAQKTSPLRTTKIGQIVLQELKKVNKLAYLRYASVYKSINDPEELKEELQLIVKR
jgi:transcriptional repressor NrdR